MKNSEIMKKLLLSVLALAMLLSLAVPGFADEGEETAQETEQTEAEELPAAVGSEEEFLEIVENAIAELQLQRAVVSVAFCYTATGETYYYNPEVWLNTASLYKLPLCMMIDKRRYEGEDFSKLFGGKLDYNMKEALALSRYSATKALYSTFFPGGLQDFRSHEMELVGMTEDELPETFTKELKYNTPFVMAILRELYYNIERYSAVIEYTSGAQYGEYLSNIDHEKYDVVVAQKYGSEDYNHHIAGIVFCDTPVLIAVETNSAGYPSANKLMGMLSEAFIEYSRVLDGRLEQ